MVKRDSSLQRTRFHYSRVQWWRDLYHSSRGLALRIGDLRLVCGCSAMETHFMKLPMNSSCTDITFRGTELFSKALLLPVFVYGDCMVVCLMLFTCQQRVWLKKPNPLIWTGVHIQLKSEVYIHLSQIHLNIVFPQFLTFNPSKNSLF
jgi:hypothetical protein